MLKRWLGNMGAAHYTKRILDNYCVLDTETTGLSPYSDEVIEIGILKIRGGIIVDEYSQLIKPKNRIDTFITELTGITNRMVQDKPSIKAVEKDVLSFLGDDVIVGHNTSFDIRFLNAGFKKEICNDYMDTVQFARKVYPELEHHSLSDLTIYLGLSNNSHRSIADCIATHELYEVIKKTMNKKKLKIADLWAK